MPLYSSLVRHQIATRVFLEKCARFQGNSRETFAEKWRMQLLSYREKNTSDTFTKPTTHFNWFRLDSDGAHKVHKCTSNISLYCGIKELSIKGLKTHMHIKCTSADSNVSLYCGFKELSGKGLKTANKHCVLHNAVSYLNKRLPSSYLGRENNNTIVVQNFTRDI